MIVKKRTTRRSSKLESFETVSTLVGEAYTMPDTATITFGDEAPIDFQARQDAISPTRRSPGGALAPKVKRTSSSPAKAKETKVKF